MIWKNSSKSFARANQQFIIFNVNIFVSLSNSILNLQFHNDFISHFRVTFFSKLTWIDDRLKSWLIFLQNKIFLQLCWNDSLRDFVVIVKKIIETTNVSVVFSIILAQSTKLMQRMSISIFSYRQIIQISRTFFLITFFIRKKSLSISTQKTKFLSWTIWEFIVYKFRQHYFKQYWFSYLLSCLLRLSSVFFLIRLLFALFLFYLFILQIIKNVLLKLTSTQILKFLWFNVSFCNIIFLTLRKV